MMAVQPATFVSQSNRIASDIRAFLSRGSVPVLCFLDRMNVDAAQPFQRELRSHACNDTVEGEPPISIRSQTNSRRYLYGTALPSDEFCTRLASFRCCHFHGHPARFGNRVLAASQRIRGADAAAFNPVSGRHSAAAHTATPLDVGGACLRQSRPSCRSANARQQDHIPGAWHLAHRHMNQGGAIQREGLAQRTFQRIWGSSLGTPPSRSFPRT